MPNYEPRHVYVVSFDDDNNDVYYNCSHDDIVFDTHTWTSQTSGVAQNILSTWYAPEVGYWIACGNNGTILKSSDGETWTDYSVSSASPAITYSLRTVKYWNDYWWIVGYGDNSTQATILRSSNGETWTSITIGTSPIIPSSLVDIGFSDDVMIFGGWTNPFSSTSGLTLLTTDGSTFAVVYHPDAAGIYGITYNINQNKFLIAGAHESSDETPYAVLSDNGVDITDEVDVSNFSWSIYTAEYNGTNYVAGSGAFGMDFKYSADGRKWKASTFDVGTSGLWPWRCTKDSKGHLHIACGNNSNTGSIYRSIDDGKTFKRVHTGSNPDMFRKVFHGQNYLIGVGDGGSIYKSGVPLANIFSGVLINPTTRSQSLNPIRANASIGNISFSFIDNNQELTRLLNTRLLSDQGLRAKRVQHWVGEKGDEWPSEYTLLQTQQFYNAIGWQDNAYTFNAQDIQRSELTDIFEPKKTTLAASLGLTETTFSVNSTTDFSLFQHGAAYSDAPNQSVLYVQIEDEIIRCTAKTSTTFTIDNESTTLSAAASANDTTLSVADHSNFGQSGVGYVVSGSPGVEYPIKWTGKSDSPHQLTGVTGVTAALDSGSAIYDLQGRGVLGTVIAEHDVDTSKSVDKRTKVTEYIYLEGPAPQLLYAILTGTVYNASPASTLPSHWNLGISAANWIATTEFTTIGTDLWDTSDDTAGLQLRFEGLKKTNAKKFIEEQILFIAGLYTPILETGELGLRRMSGVISDSAYSRVLDESNIISISNIRYDLDDIHNDFLVRWNYNAVDETYTRDVSLLDTESINKWGQARQLEIKTLGLKGSNSTDSTIGNLFNTWRDRYAGPPFKATVQLAYSERDIKIGDIVRLKLDNIPEFTDQNSAYGSLDISVEVQKISIDYRKGIISIDAFGSTKRASPLVIGNPSLDDTFYTSQGSDLASLATQSPVLATDSGGTLTITGNCTLTGVSDLNSATATADNDQGIFYYDGDITIASGVTVTITDNVEIRYKGTFTNNGTIDGKGQGLAGTSTDAGTSGYIGSTKAGGMYFWEDYSGGNYYHIQNRITVSGYGDHSATNGVVTKVNPFNIVNNNTSIAGKPGDLRGTSGGKGGDVFHGTVTTATGGNGGNGGAGLLLIGRGAVGGANSKIDLSGNDGSLGGTSGDRFVASSGAGGYPGVLYIVLDGNTVTETISPYFVANLGNSSIVGGRLPSRDVGFSNYDPLFSTIPWYSHYVGFQAESKVQSNFYPHYLTEYATPEVDTPSRATLPTAISVSEHSNTQNSVNVLGLEISATAPSDTNYKAARIYIRKQNAEGWQYAGEAASGQEVVFWVAADGSTYEIKAHSLSNTNIESRDYIDRTYTVSNSVTTVVRSGGALQSNADPSTNGGWQISDTVFRFWNTSGVLKTEVDLSSGAITEGSAILGTTTYLEDTFFLDIPAWLSIDGMVNSTSGSGSVSANQGNLSLSVTSTLNDQARSYLLTDTLLDIGTWGDYNRKFKVKIIFTNADSTLDWYILCGLTPPYLGGGFGFWFDSGQWKAFNTENGSNTTTNVTISTGDVLEAIYNITDSEITFYVNGSLVATHTTNLPDGGDTSTKVVLFTELTRSSAGVTTRTAELAQYKLLIGY